MTRKIENAADTPVEVYDYWHQVWCDYLNDNYKDKFVEAGKEKTDSSRQL